MNNNHYPNSSYYSSNGGTYYPRDTHYNSHYYSQDGLSGRPPTYRGSDFDYSNSTKAPSASWNRDGYYYEATRYKSYSSDSYLNDPYYLPKRSDYPVSTSPPPYVDSGRKYDFNSYPSSSGYRAVSPERYSNIPPPTSYPISSYSAYPEEYFRSGYAGPQSVPNGYEPRLDSSRDYEAVNPYRAEHRWPPSKLDESRSYRRWGKLDDYSHTIQNNGNSTVAGAPALSTFDSPQKRSSFYWRNWDSKLSSNTSFKSKKLLSPVGTTTAKTEMKVNSQSKVGSKTTQAGHPKGQKEIVNSSEKSHDSKEVVDPVEEEKPEQISDPNIESLVKNCLNIIDYKIKLSLISLNMNWEMLQKNLEEMKIETTKEEKTQAASKEESKESKPQQNTVSTKSVKDSGTIEAKVEMTVSSDQSVSSLKRPSELDLSQSSQKKKLKPTEDNSNSINNNTGRNSVASNGPSVSTPTHTATPTSKPATNLPPPITTSIPRTKEELRNHIKSKEALSKITGSGTPSTQQLASHSARKVSQPHSNNTSSTTPTGPSSTPRITNPLMPASNKTAPKEAPVLSVPLSSQSLDGSRDPTTRTTLPSRDHVAAKPKAITPSNSRIPPNLTHTPAPHRSFPDSGPALPHPMDVDRRRGFPHDRKSRDDWINPVDWAGTRDDWRAPVPDYSRPGDWSRNDTRNSSYDPSLHLNGNDMPRSSSYDWRDDRYRYDYPPPSGGGGGVPSNGPPYYKYDDNSRYNDNYSRRRDDPYYPSTYPPPISGPSQSYPPIDSNYGRSWDGPDRAWIEADRSKPPYDYPNRGSHPSNQPGNMPPSSYPPRRDSGGGYYDRKYY